MRDRIKIEFDKARTMEEKKLEVLLDIRELIAGKEVKEEEPFGGPMENTS